MSHTLLCDCRSEDTSDEEVLLEEQGQADTAAHSCSDSEGDSAASSAHSSGSGPDSDASSDSELADLVEEDPDAIAGDCQ